MYRSNLSKSSVNPGISRLAWLMSLFSLSSSCGFFLSSSLIRFIAFVKNMVYLGKDNEKGRIATEGLVQHGFGKKAVQCSVSSEDEMVHQTLVLRINICGENRHLRQARKR
jgi:hypothetical protein